MNPDTPLTPREETEMRLTALLMGELSPEEAAIWEGQIAADAELTALSARLRKAVELLHEASAIPEQAATPVPSRLSDERRERLLAHFKTVAAPIALAKPRRDWSWVVPLGLAASLIALLGGTVLMNGFALRKSMSVGYADFASEEIDALPAESGRTHWNEQPGTIRTTPSPVVQSRVEFEGLINYGSPIQPTTATGAPSLVGARQAGDAGQRDEKNAPAMNGERDGAKGDVRFGQRSDIAASAAPASGPGISGSGTVTISGGISLPAAPATPPSGPALAAIEPAATALPRQYSTSEVSAAKETKRFLGADGSRAADGGAGGSGGSAPESANRPVALARGIADGNTLADGDERLAMTPTFELSSVAPVTKSAPVPPAKAASASHGPGELRSDLTPADDSLAPTDSRLLMLGDIPVGGKPAAGAAPGFELREKIAQSGKDRAGLVSRDREEAASSDFFASTTTVAGGTLLNEERKKSWEWFGDFAGGDKASPDGLSDAPKAADVAKREKKSEHRRIENQVGLASAAADAKLALETMTAVDGFQRNDSLRSGTESKPEAGEVRERLKEWALGAPSADGRALFNKAIGSQPGAGSEQAARYSREAEGFYDSGRYDFAFKRTEQLLNADPGNVEARELQEKISKAMSDKGIASYNETRSRAGEKLDKAWAEPNRPIREAAPADKLVRAAEPVALAKLKLPALEKVVKPEEKLKELSEEVTPPKPAAPAPVPQSEVLTSENAFSTFSLNVSDVAFKLAGASLEQGKMPELATVRSEEFINAFDYRDPEPAGNAPLACTTERARYPFAQNRDLLRCSVKTAAAGRQPGRALNIVLVLDNSGSMERADRVRILREALRVLAAQLQPQDKLSVVTFARTPRLWADGVAGDKAAEVTARVGEITPQGGTNIAAALDLGYATALRHYTVGSINRVVLLTDGAANLGDVSPDALKQKVEAHRKQGVALDCFGIGWEGLNDDLLEQLSRNGDGRYGFINTPEEAATEFAGQLAGALRVAASDVKVQVEFNPRRVTSYRQIGYAKHQLKKEQFRDNTVDAAEIGAAESGNALYVCEVNPRGEGELATVRVRFKVPGTSDYREHEWTVPFTREAQPLEQASPALRLAGTASAFSEWLVASQYASEVTPDRLLGLLNGVPAIYGADPRPKKLEWMIRTAKSLSGR